ncbi:DUF5979 domain-containing protein [Cellulomonas sp.]|uniref:DUF5979 domain-containing protein n=1 Tax=Cellulomonas sp. TaxID=40001 RepID=UPI0028116868|nr:DUF5979 domain-containing protein [Cellulomonas sp.]
MPAVPARVPVRRPARRRGSRRGWSAALAALLVGALALPLATAPAAAAEPEFLALTKTVSRSELAPGDEYTYRVQVTCSEESCLDAVLVDTLGELAGHTLRDVTFRTSDPALTYEPTWTSDGRSGSDAPARVAADTALSVRFTQATTSPAGTGMQSGQTFTVAMTLVVPTDLPPGTDVTLDNVATVDATNSAPADGTATVHVTVPVVVDVAPTKSWTPSPQAFSPGAPSTIRVTARNTSNVPVDRLVLQDPQDAPEGATALAAGNPFGVVDLTGLSAVSVPAQCTDVSVDAYVRRDGAWTWVPGTGGLALPAGVDPADVAGVRVTCAGDDVPVGAELALDLAVAQRAEHRETGADLSLASRTTENVVAATVLERDGAAPVTRTARAAQRVDPARLGTEVTKTFTPARVSAGESSTLMLTAANTSDVAVRELRVRDLDFFGTDVRLTGFAGAPAWPTGATAASVVYHLAGGGTAEVPFGEGEVPAPPSGGTATGLEIVFTGAIEPGGDLARAELVVQTDERTDGATREHDNAATAVVTAPNGATAQDGADARLTVVPAAIDVTLVKTVRPGSAVRPGDRVVAELHGTVAVSSSYVTAERLDLTDAWDGAASGFWNAFDLTGVAPTQVPSGTAVEVRVQTAVGTWHTVRTEAARAESWLLALDASELAAGLPGGVALTDVTGIAFDLTSADGFAANTAVTPYVVTQARATLRTGGALPAGTTTLTNAAVAQAAGTTAGGTAVDDDADAGDDAAVQPAPDGDGSVHAGKRWSAATVAAQSGQQRTTTLTWRTAAGFAEVAVSDPADVAPVEATTADAFDLVRIAPVAYASGPFTNGWYLRYDTVTDVQLLLPGAGGPEWASVPAPAGGWMSASGFVGHTLTADQRRDALGARLVLAEDTAARTAAAQPGPALDPYAPAPGSGVAAASTDRSFGLVWQVREVRRSATQWVTGRATYNTADAGVVRNTVRVDGRRPDDTVASVTAHDDIRITDATPLVRLEKQVAPGGDVHVPRAGTVAPQDMPTRTFTVTAWNDSVARASYVRVTDPACSDVDVQGNPCALDDPTADPFVGGVDWLAPGGTASVFDRFDLVDVRFAATRPGEVDLAASTAWVLRRDGGAYRSERTTAAALLAAPAAELADVVGVSVTFQGTDPATTGGTLTQGNRLSLVLDTRLRTHLRSTGEPQTLRAGQRVEAENTAYAQSYDPVLDPDGTVLAAATARAVAPLTGGEINVASSKSVSPATVAAPARGAPVTVTLGADQGTAPRSTLAPAEVRLRDDATTSPQFWDEFDLLGLRSVTLPAGADRVRVDAYGPFGADGALAWVEGTATTADALALPVPAERTGDVQGLLFTFHRADGGFFSSVVPAPGWAAQAVFDVRLRDATRGTGEPITLDGADRAVENTVVAQSDRLDGDASEQRASAALVRLSEGTHRIGVTKLANGGDRVVDVGTAVPWDLSFENTGTGYLTVTELRDTLPSSLVWTGETAPVVTTTPGGLLGTDVRVERDGADVVLTWPQDARTMAPGERVTVRLLLELQPGLTESDRAVNTMTVRTAETLEACSPLDAARPVTGAWAADATTCGAQDHVSPRGGPNLFTVKGVRGAGDGAATAGGAECEPLLDATGGAYYRTPCIARSVAGGVDDWVLRVVNGGTTSVDELTVFDQLSAPDDTMIVSGSRRGSTHRPQVVAGSLRVSAPSGATVVTEVTTTAQPCVATWGGLTTLAVCEQNGEEWQAVSDATDWSAVTGLRVRVDLRTSAAGALRSGEHVDVTFSTRNVLATADAPDGVPVTGADEVVAVNQFGVKYRDTGASTWKKIAPATVGVRVPTGPLEVRKVVDGPAAGYAPDAFTATLACTFDGAPLDLGAAAAVTLDAAGGFAARVDGVPVGAECQVTEDGAPGSFGETERDGVARVVVAAPAAADGTVPAGQVATLTNTYRYSGLSVSKVVDTEATAGDLGPFTFALTCTAAGTGAPVALDGAAEELTFALRGGETFTTPDGVVPAGATCVLRETDGGGADRVVLVGDGVRPTGDGEAEVLVGAGPAAVVVTNGFDAGVLEVRKDVDGAGAGTWGTGPFGFTAVCTYAGGTVLDEEFTLAAGGVRTFGTFPVGTTCRVEEAATAGATSTTLAPADGVVAIAAPQAGEVVSTAVVTATNTFDLTSVAVTKRVDGDAAAAALAGPFTVELACTWPRDGEDVELEVPGGAVRELRAGATTTYAGLPVGADCVLAETATGGAARTAMTVRVGDADDVVTSGVRAPVVGLSSTTEPGEAAVEVVNTFDPLPAVAGDGAGAGAALAVTGADVARAAAVVALLLAVGAGLVLAVRRRRA